MDAKDFASQWNGSTLNEINDELTRMQARRVSVVMPAADSCCVNCMYFRVKCANSKSLISQKYRAGYNSVLESS